MICPSKTSFSNSQPQLNARRLGVYQIKYKSWTSNEQTQMRKKYKVFELQQGGRQPLTCRCQCACGATLSSIYTQRSGVETLPTGPTESKPATKSARHRPTRLKWGLTVYPHPPPLGGRGGGGGVTVPQSYFISCQFCPARHCLISTWFSTNSAKSERAGGGC